MPGQFVLLKTLEFAVGSDERCPLIDVAVLELLWSSGPFWVRSVKKLRCSQKQQSSLFCRNELVSYDSLLLVNAAVRLH